MLNQLTNYQNIGFDRSLINIVLVIGILIGVTSSFVNVVAGVELIVHITNFVVLGVYLLIYYQTRVKGRYDQMTLPLIIVTILFLDVLWLMAGGLDSPMIFYVFLSTTCFIIFSNAQVVRVVSLAALLNLVVLILIEGNTDWVVPYPDEDIRFLDFGISSIVALALMIILISWLKYNYNLERQRVIQKNEKIETLIRELHHRVKNNLQVISSLLGLQSKRLTDEQAVKAVREGKERINAMSLIHRKLYQQEEINALNIREYINELLRDLTQSYGFQEKVKVNIDIPDILLDLDTTIPLGLIVNEVATNSFKYAFEKHAEPQIDIQISQEREDVFSLLYQDNGSGIPKEIDTDTNDSFGLKLIRLLVLQLEGSHAIESQNGLKLTLTFNSKAA